MIYIVTTMKDVEFTTRSRELTTGAYDQELEVTVGNAETTTDKEAIAIATEIADRSAAVSMLKGQLPLSGCER